jgi:hypothetical protein
MIVAITEGHGIQALTDAAAGASGSADLCQEAVLGLLRYFSRPAEPT